MEIGSGKQIFVVIERFVGLDMEKTKMLCYMGGHQRLECLGVRTLPPSIYLLGDGEGLYLIIWFLNK